MALPCLEWPRLGPGRWSRLLDRADALAELLHTDERLVLRANALVDGPGHVDELLPVSAVAMGGVDRVHHGGDLLDRLGDLLAAARLLLARALHVLRDHAHLLGALHDEVAAA